MQVSMSCRITLELAKTLCNLASSVLLHSFPILYTIKTTRAKMEVEIGICTGKPSNL
jgi:hypothetical protein